MRNAECGIRVRNAECGMRNSALRHSHSPCNLWDTRSIFFSRIISAFRTPHSALDSALRISMEDVNERTEFEARQ